MTTLHIEDWPLERLVPYAQNPRKNDHAVAKMVEAIRSFGFRIPVLARSSGELIDGHLRLKAALAAGLHSIPVIPADDMTPEQVRAFRIMVNRSATWADWDEDLLLQELQALQEAGFNLELTGFDQRELDAMLMQMEAGGKDPDAVPPAPECPVVKDGEIWLLGRHRLMCGDATSLADVGRLMFGEYADMVWTDPPYNVDYAGKAGKIKNDKMPAEKFDAFLLAVHRAMLETLKAGGAIYVAHSEAGDGMAFRRAFISAGFKLAACLIWRKQTAVLGRGDYHFQHEPILYGWKPGAAHRWYGNRKQRTVFDAGLDGIECLADGSCQLHMGGKVYRISGEALQVEELSTSIIYADKPARSDLHPTTKPVALVEVMVANSSPRAGLVLDPFGGSGSTLLACERLGRQCRMLELDPKFVEVIIRRWEDYTGLQACRDADGLTLDELCAASAEITEKT